MTIAFLPWPTSIYFRSKSACELLDDSAIHGPLPVLFRAVVWMSLMSGPADIERAGAGLERRNTRPRPFSHCDINLPK